MATENRKAITVGIFLSLGLLIFILGVFTLGGQQKNFAKSIKLDAVFDDVAGLKKGNDVWFSGVKVGNITSIKFVGTSEVRVEMKVDQSTQQYIHSNSAVKIGSDGLIGNKIIVIDGGSPQAPMVEDGAQLHAEKLLSTDDILKTLQQNNQNLLSITGDFKTLSHQILQGKGTVGTLLADSAMGLQLRRSMQNLQTATQSAARLASELDRFSNKMNTKGGLADKVLTDTVVYSHLQASVARLQQAAANVTSFTDNLSKMSSKLNSKDNAVGVLLNDPKAAAQVQNAITNLQQSSIKLNDDLEAVQHNFLLKGFFKKKEKAKQDSLKRK